ncbi:MAG: cytochrome c [Pyrinomonadaceae bacterium]
MKFFVIFCFVALISATLTANSLAFKTTAINFADDEISGKELFKNNCARCHGADGTGGKGPNLTTEKKQAKWKDSDEKLIAKIAKGAFGMPAFGDKLKPEEIQAISDYVRTFQPPPAK